MKLNLIALVTLLGGAPNAVLSSSLSWGCEEKSGVCACLGSCPSFTDSWVSQEFQGQEQQSICVAIKDENTAQSLLANGLDMSGIMDMSKAGEVGRHFVFVCLHHANKMHMQLRSHKLNHTR